MFSKQVAKMAKQAKVLAKKKFYQVYSTSLHDQAAGHAWRYGDLFSLWSLVKVQLCT